MRLFLVLWVTLAVTCVLVDSGRIVRTWRRRGGGITRRQSSHPWSPFQYWTRYFRPNPRRVIRRHHIPSPLLPQRPHQDEDAPSHLIPTQNGRSSTLTPWRPLEYGNPITRDPTFAYAPPTNENVKFGNPKDSRRRQLGGPPRRRWRPRPPPRTTTSLWRLLTRARRPMRPRRPRPPPHPHHNPHQQPQQSDEAEVTPYLPNIVYFQPKDFITTTTTTTTSTTTEKALPGTEMKPGHVSDVPLYPTQSTSASEFQPVLNKLEAFKPMPVEKEYIFRVLSVTGLNKEPTLLQPILTEAPPTSTERTAPAPTLELATESILELLQQPPSPINSFNINIDPGAEGSDDFLKFVEIPRESPLTTTTTEATTTTTATPTTTTPKFIPIFPVRVLISSSAATTTSTTTTSTTETPLTTTTEETTEADEEVLKNHRVHPTMTAYKKRPVFPKKPNPVTKVSGKASPGVGSGESITITGIRSKVKSYKPQHLANYTQLLSFDKVAETSPLPVVVVQLPASSLSTELISLTSNSSSTEKSNSSTTSVTSSSPMQQFDPLKLIHSWFIKN